MQINARPPILLNNGPFPSDPDYGESIGYTTFSPPNFGLNVRLPIDVGMSWPRGVPMFTFYQLAQAVFRSFQNAPVGIPAMTSQLITQTVPAKTLGQAAPEPPPGVLVYQNTGQ